MLKKINQYLLLNHPLLWNLKVVPVLLFALILHTFFFVIGYLSGHNLSILKEYNYDGSNDIQVFIFAGLIIAIGLILWLIHYLRHNAFKSFYPVSKRKLRAEFAWVFFIFILNLPVFHTYLFARNLRLKQISAHLDPVKAAETINLAMCFIPTNTSKFDSENSCDTINARAARAAAIPVTPDYCSDNDNTSDVDAGEFSATVVTAEASPEPTPSSVPTVEVHEYLYGNYCQKAIETVEFESSAEDYHHTAKRYLEQGKKDSIKLCLKQYFDLMKTYKCMHLIEVDTLVAWCFLDSKHSVYHTVSNYYPSYYDTPKIGYMEGEFDNLNTMVGNIATVNEETVFPLEVLVTYLLVAFGMSVILMLFRLTRLKPWIAAIIGSGIWAIIFGLMGFFFNENIQFILILFSLLSLLLARMFIHNQEFKFSAALWLQWFTYTFMSIFPLIMYNIYENTRAVSKCVNHVWVVVEPAPPIHQWIDSNWPSILLINFGIGFLVFLFLIIPLCFRWQANPAE